MKRTKALLAALSALCVTFSAMVSVSAADEPQSTTGAQPENGVVQNNELTMENAGACIGNTPYLNWRVAMSWAKKGQTIKVLEDYTDGAQNFGQIMWLAYDDITLDLNGHTIDLGNSYLTVPSSLKITDSSNEKTGQIISNYITMNITSGGDVELDNVKIQSDNASRMVDGKEVRYNTIVNNGGNLIIKDSTVTGHEYGAIEIDAGEVEVNGDSTSIEGLAAISVYGNNTELTINEGKIEAYSYAISGNGTPGLGGTTININGGTISSEKGTGIYIPQDGTVNIDGGHIQGVNTAVEVVSGTVNITGGLLECTGNEIAFRNATDKSGAQYAGAALALVGRSVPDGSSGYTGDMVINIS